MPCQYNVLEILTAAETQWPIPRKEIPPRRQNAVGAEYRWDKRPSEQTAAS